MGRTVCLLTSQPKGALQISSILQVLLESLLEIGDLLLSGFPAGSGYHGQSDQQDLLDMLRRRIGYCTWSMGNGPPKVMSDANV